MIPLEQMQAQSVDFIVTRVDGEKLHLTMRAYTMADHVWFQRNFTGEEDANALAAMQIEPIAKIGWQMLDEESKKEFSNITFMKYDEGLEKDIKVDARGYEKLVHSLKGEQSFWAIFDAFCHCKGMNGFMEPDDVGLKKKKRQKRKKKSTGRKLWIF